MSYQYPEDDDTIAPTPGIEPRRRRTSRSGFDLSAIGIGTRVALTMLLVGLAAMLIILLWNPSSSRTPAPTATILAAEGEPVLPTFTPGATATPLATETPAAATAAAGATSGPAGEVAVGGSALVGNTDGAGANLRQEPSTSATVVQLMAEGTTLTVLEGPQDAEGFQWWRVQIVDSETTGWVAGAFLQAAAAGE